LAKKNFIFNFFKGSSKFFFQILTNKITNKGTKLQIFVELSWKNTIFKCLKGDLIFFASKTHPFWSPFTPSTADFLVVQFVPKNLAWFTAACSLSLYHLSGVGTAL